MNTTPDDGMNDLVRIVHREPLDELDDDSSYFVMPLESLQVSPWPPDDEKKSEET